MRGLYRVDHGHEHLAIPIDGRYLPRESLAHVASPNCKAFLYCVARLAQYTVLSLQLHMDMLCKM